MPEEFRPKFRTFAGRMVELAPRCVNEESTKLFLILPFLSFLGYDISNPDEVCPEHNADYSEKYKNRVDFAILKERTPIIAIECKALGTPLRDERGQLRSYFNAAATIKMGIITDGLVYEFYADSDQPHIMDKDAFLRLDMREIAKGKIDDSIEDGLKKLTKPNFDPESIGATAKQKILFLALVREIAKLAENPTEPFVRMLLQNTGITNIRAKALGEYAVLTQKAFHEFVKVRILEGLDSKQPPEVEAEEAASGEQLSNVERAIIGYSKRRLCFLVEDDDLFNEIEKIESRKYKGKLVVFYKKERVGRLFDFYEGKTGEYLFDFGQLGGEMATDKLTDIDEKLLAAFKQRVASMSKVGAPDTVEEDTTAP